MQAVFLSDRGFQIPARVGTYRNIFTEANGLIGRARSGQVLERRDIDSLRRAVIADYQRRFDYDPDKVLTLGLLPH